MSHSEHHHAHDHTAMSESDKARACFTDAEWHQFQSDDRHAGGAVLVLMTAIFSIGLVLYFGVYLWVGMN